MIKKVKNEKKPHLFSIFKYVTPNVYIYMYIYIYVYIFMVFTTKGLLEVAIESWTEWDLNPRPLNSVQTL